MTMGLLSPQKKSGMLSAALVLFGPIAAEWGADAASSSTFLGVDAEQAAVQQEHDAATQEAAVQQEDNVAAQEDHVAGKRCLAF